MRSDAVLQVDYCSSQQLAARAPRWWDSVLGAVSFAGSALSADSSEFPTATIDTPVLGAAGGLYEIWHTARRAASGRRGDVRYRHNDDILFGHVAMNEVASDIATPGRSGLELATDAAYRQIFGLLDALGFPHLLRVWNYFAQINHHTHGDERYRQFNRARQEAFTACGRALIGSVPAASALGSAAGSPLAIYFIAGRALPTMLENPRQVSAYHYPPQYGARSPTFSRASVAHGANGSVLFISGTASIIGHETLHAGDVAAQTREALANIDLLLIQAKLVLGSTRFRRDALCYKIYVRRAQDLAVIQAQIASSLDPSTRVIYLQADICRADLLVEIEATGSDGVQGGV